MEIIENMKRLCASDDLCKYINANTKFLKAWSVPEVKYVDITAGIIAFYCEQSQKEREKFLTLLKESGSTFTFNPLEGHTDVDDYIKYFEKNKNLAMACMGLGHYFGLWFLVKPDDVWTSLDFSVKLSMIQYNKFLYTIPPHHRGKLGNNISLQYQECTT